MRVLVTGGTGYVGSHAAAALVRHGHEVRLLVRSPERVARSLGPLGIGVPDVVVGDITDAGSIDTALSGCAAVVHAASVYSLDPRDAPTIAATNVRGTETVLGAARRAGVDPIVYVSSYVGLLPATGILGPESPVGDPTPPYARSKADSEIVARRHQEQGAPVVSVYPGSVWGPHDPYCGESCRLLSGILTNRLPFAIRGGLPIADVRYVASVLAATVEPGKGPRRFMVGGHDTRWNELFAHLRRLTGRRLRAMPTPRPVATGFGRLMDGAQRLLPGKAPLAYEGIYIATQDPKTDDTRTAAELGVVAPPLEETLTDTIRWMLEAGRIPAKAAGRIRP
jgi:nucleoside-diphosphate-sugar epimerase